jgi:hypothetical protein
MSRKRLRLPRPSSQKYLGQAKKAAVMLFGLPEGKQMESPAQRQHMIDILNLSANPIIKDLAVRAADPLLKRYSFARLTETCAVPYESIMKEYVSIQRTRGLQGMAGHLPTVMEQTALAALVRDETCPKCNGINSQRVRLKNLHYGPCPKCDGTGLVKHEADPEAVKLMFNTFGLTAVAGSASANATVQINLDSQSMEDLSRDVAGIIEGTVVSK